MKIIYLESILLEKSPTKPDKRAMEILTNSGLFTQEESKNIIDDLFTNKTIKAFTHAKPWMDKYIKGVARMIVEESNGDKSKAEQFIKDSKNIDIFNEYLKYVKENRDKQDSPTDFDTEFVDKLSFSEIKDFVENRQKELDKKSKDELSKMEFEDDSDYELIPIDSYDELHSKFGGKLTGNGTGDSSAWCHTNGEYTYNSWINQNGGGNKFFILARKDFKDIPFNKKSNSKNPKDEYGNSLIALLVSRYGNLKNATLRCNHEGIEDGLPDNQYKTYAELSKLVGFNVEKKIRELGSFEELPITKDGIWYYDGKEIDEDFNDEIIKVIVEEGVTEIGVSAFQNCKSLKEIIIPDSVTKIENYAFSRCTSLKEINIPDSVTEIGFGAFHWCTSLTSIRIPDNVTVIGDYAFVSCKSLTNIIIPDSVTKIGENVFQDCTSLTNIIIPDSITEIGDYAFRNCYSLTNITIPDSVTKIGIFVFFKCPNLTVKCYKGSYAERYCILSGIKYELI